MPKIKILFLLFVFWESIMGQSVRLNEIVTRNGDNLYDEDGDTPDWIELHNPSNEIINLIDFGITDDSQIS